MRVRYRIDIDCAGCAREVEEAVSGIEEISSVRVDFINKRMTVEVDDALMAGYTDIEREIVRVAHAAEPEFQMWPMDERAEEDEERQRFPWELIVGIAFLILGLLLEHVIETDIDGNILRCVFLVGLLITGYDVFVKAARNILGRSFLDENFLMAIATVAALAIGYWTESVAIMVFYKIGEFFEERAVMRSRSSVKALMGLKVPYTTVIRDGTETSVRTETVHVGETIVIRPGEMVPIDGVIESGESFMDTRAMTGEPVPRHVSEGEEVLSGFVNTDSVIRVRTVRPYEDSAAAKVLALIEDSHSRKSKSERFITTFAKYYTPAVVLCAALIAVIPSLISPDDWLGWVYKGIVFLVVSCPCALVLSIPLTYFCGIGNASRHGILVKGSVHIEAMSKASAVVFDKTGTLTRGEFSVVKVEPSGMSEEELLRYVSVAESDSNHPIARSICSYAGRTDAQVSGGKHISGMGITANVDGKEVAVGNVALMQSIGIDLIDPDVPGTHVHAAVDGIYAGHILISDTLKHDSKEAVERLRGMGIRSYMLTGDSRSAAEGISGELGLDGFEADLLPADKTSRLEALIEGSEGRTVFVGDGINDAPSLARADVGIAMGNLGSDAAIEAADMVIVDDHPSKVADAVAISRRTQAIVIENIVFALGVKFAILGLTTFTDLISMWIAILGDVGVLILAVANATRALGGMSAPAEKDGCCCGECHCHDDDDDDCHCHEGCHCHDDDDDDDDDCHCGCKH